VNVTQQLIITFSCEVLAQEEAIRFGQAGKGNTHAERYVEAAVALLGDGEASITAFAALLAHRASCVRRLAAEFLLPHRPEEAAAVLREIAAGTGADAIAARIKLERQGREERQEQYWL
jgi:hypothetical protein